MAITFDRNKAPTPKAAQMRGGSIAFVVVKSSHVLSSDHVPGSLLRNGRELYHCILTAALSEEHTGDPLLQVRKPPNCPLNGGGDCGANGLSHQPGRGPPGSPCPRAAEVGQGREEEELGGPARLSTGALWNGLEGPSDPPG